MYIEWRRQLRSGMKRLQKDRLPLYRRAKLFRIYEPTLIPGLFQTADYASAIMAEVIEFQEIPNDLDEAVAARMERQHVLYTGDRRFLVVLEEQALLTQIGNIETMAGQLDRLMTVLSLQRLSLGIIPAAHPRHILPGEGFWIFDDEAVKAETWTAGLTITQPREIAVYAKAFARLQRSAVYGREARQLISKALADLENPRLTSSQPPDGE